jgi:hypothetical protein
MSGLSLCSGTRLKLLSFVFWKWSIWLSLAFWKFAEMDIIVFWNLFEIAIIGLRGIVCMC